MARLTRDDWTTATLAAVAASGLPGVNIEQIAARLGSTKGSFYHHFEDRDALIAAALSWWEQDTENMLNELRGIADPLERLAASNLDAVAENHGFLDVALIAAMDNPLVARAVRRVNEMRIDFLAETIELLGVDSSLSRLRAAEGLGAYLGLFTLQRIMAESYDQESMATHIDRVAGRMHLP